MCGLAGYIGNERITDSHVRACLGQMKRRGPDAADVYHHRHRSGFHLTLLHSRLSIIDLDERANQPFRCGDSVLAYNGELYNYVELREKLARRGVKFRTASDTEVLAKTLLHYGHEGLDQCEGMWAIAFYDEETGSLLLSRDRFGEKPLYLYRGANGLYFGSEVKFIVELVGRNLPINYSHLYRYLVNGYKSLYKVNETFFDGLEELRPGEILTRAANGKEQRRKYWTPRIQQDDSMSYEDAVNGVRERLIESVRLRLRADVPLAFCMSGGIDSNSLICTAKRVLDYDVHGFTIVNTDSRYEEQAEVEYVVRKLNLRHTSVPISTQDFLERLRELVRYHDAPVYTITYFAHWTLMKHIHDQGYRISVSGTAADELFTGYYDHHLYYLSEIHDNSPLFDSALSNWQMHVAPHVRNPLLRDQVRFIQQPEFRDHIYFNSADFATFLHPQWSEAFQESTYCEDVLRNRMLNELFSEITPVILHEDDLNSMYYSIENRSPFLDRELFEFTTRIPTRYLIQSGAAKAVLRDAMRGIVPDRILDNRRKVGFNAPILSYLDTKDPAVREYLLVDSPIYETRTARSN